MQKETLTSYGKILGGKLVLSQPALLAESLRDWKEGTQVEFTIKKWRTKHSDEQRGWYRGVVLPMITDGINDQMGEIAFDRDAIHSYMCQLFNLKTLVGEGGKVSRIAQGTTLMTTVEFMDFCEKCRKWAGEMLSLTIPDPIPELGKKYKKARVNNNIFVEDGY